MKRVMVAFGAAIVLVAGVEVVAYRTTETLVANGERVEHTRVVREQLDALTAAVVDAQAARRGYALTGDPRELAPRATARERASVAMMNLRSLVADDPSQAARLEAATPLVDAALRDIDAAIEARREGGFDLGREAAATSTTGREVQAVRAAIDAMIADEQQLLALREQRTEETLRRARVAELGGTALAMLLLGLAVARLLGEMKRRVASEARAHDGERRLETLLDSIADGVIATDAEGLVTRMNPVASELTGWSEAEARGRPATEVFRIVAGEGAEEDAPPHPLTRALAEKRVVDLAPDAVLVAKGGERRPVADSAAPIRDDDGAVRGAVLVFRDVAAEIEAAREVRRAHRFLDSIVENIPNMVFVKDAAELAFVRLNRAGELLLGMKREDLVGKSDFAFFPVEQAKAFVAKDREALRGGEVVDIPEEPLATASGTRWLHTKKVPILDERGEPEYLLGISEDVTERRRQEAALREAKDAAEAATRELESFSYSVAHDLRAPLRSIDGFSLALLEDHGERLDGEAKDYLKRVRAAAGRMASLIDDLLALARMSRVDLVRERVDLTALAREVGAEQNAARGARAEIVVEDGLVADADPRLVRVLFENLLANAVKFSGRRDDARVEVGADGAGAFFVRDNGAGFDSKSATKLFTAFQRYHRPTEFDGTGVGLATVQRIAARHGGRVWAESAPGEGATFFFTLSASAKGTT